MNKNAQEFMGLLFASRHFAHSAHLNTGSYAEHMALGSFYSDIVCLADSFAETWMGNHEEKIGDIPQFKFEFGDPLGVLKHHLGIVKKSRSFVPVEDSELNNIIDEIEALYESTIYKLKFLK